MNLLPWRKPSVARSDPVLAFDEWVEILTSFSFQGINYTLPGAKQEDLDGRYPLMARAAYKANGVVFACVAARVRLFSEARFAFRKLNDGRPGDLTYRPSTQLELLKTPWVGGTTGDLLARMLIHADIAGNAYVARRAGKLALLRPDWVTIVGGVRGDSEASVWHPDAEVIGYLYQEGGPALGKPPMVLLPEEVAHFAPNPDPEARFRGMSWLTPVIREIMADKAATEHKLAFFENGATPNLAVSLPIPDLETAQKWIEAFDGDHAGAANAYKTMWLVQGADVTVIGKDLQQLEFKVTQGAGETRIAAAAEVPPVVVGLSEGLQAATYSNYGQARRRFADQTMRPLWRNVCGSLARIIDVPRNAELWYDDRDISALQEDQKDAAEIMQLASSAIKTFVDAGYEPESAVAAVAANDMTLLVHTGLVSVQLQPPGTTSPPQDGSGVNGQAVVPAVNGG